MILIIRIKRLERHLTGKDAQWRWDENNQKLRGKI